jgi:hypothetical protein
VLNQRVAEASALRRFFQEQWDYLQQLLDDYREEQLREERESEELAEAVEALVNGTDKRLRSLSSYQKRLRESAHQLLDYVEEITGSVPPALHIDRKSLVLDPTVGRLFRNWEQIRGLFRENPAIPEFFQQLDNQDQQVVFALLFLMRSEQITTGSEMRGEILVRDVLQTSVGFFGHELLEPRKSEAEARLALKQILFDSAVAHIKKETVAMRHGRSEEEKRAALLNPEENINNPAVYLRILTELLAEPRELLKLSNSQLNINRMGIKLPLDSANASELMHLYEVEVGEERARLVSLVCFPRAEVVDEPWAPQGAL